MRLPQYPCPRHTPISHVTVCQDPLTLLSSLSWGQTTLFTTAAFNSNSPSRSNTSNQGVTTNAMVDLRNTRCWYAISSIGRLASRYAVFELGAELRWQEELLHSGYCCKQCLALNWSWWSSLVLLGRSMFWIWLSPRWSGVDWIWCWLGRRAWFSWSRVDVKSGPSLRSYLCGCNFKTVFYLSYYYFGRVRYLSYIWRCVHFLSSLLAWCVIT